MVGRWNVLRFSILCLASLAMVAMFTAQAQAQMPERVDSVRQGELTNLLRHDCGSCHGLTMKGGLGRPLLPDYLADWSEEQIASVILDGVPGSAMPPWRPLLTQHEADWIAAQLKRGLPQ